MSFDGFLAFDPFLSFGEGQRGFEEKIFLRSDGVPTATWYDRGHDGKEYLPSMWRIGRDAYAIVASRMDRQPTAEDFLKIAAHIRQFEAGCAPLMQKKIDDASLVLHEDRDSPPVENITENAKVAPDGWVTEVYMRMMIPSVISGDVAAEEIPDFEEFLSAAAVLYLDDYLIAENIGVANLDLYHHFVQVNLSSAKMYRESLKAAREARSSNGRKSAEARHKEGNTQKKAALHEWDTSGHTYSSIAAFARLKHKAYGVTERTLNGWVADHRKGRS